MPQILVWIGQAKAHNNNQREAIDYFLKCLDESDTGNFNGLEHTQFMSYVHYNLGHNYNVIGEYQEAEFHLKRVLEIDEISELFISREEKSFRILETYKTLSELGQVYMN